MLSNLTTAEKVGLGALLFIFLWIFGGAMLAGFVYGNVVLGLLGVLLWVGTIVFAVYLVVRSFRE